MYPDILKIGDVILPNWGVAFTISFLIGIMVSLIRAPHLDLTLSAVIDISLLVIITAVLGSRFWYVATHFAKFKVHWIKIFDFAGLSMMGGVILAVLATLVYARMKHLNFLTLGDVFAPSFLLGAGIMRLLGCYSVGCCYGRPTESFLGVIFPQEGIAGSFFPNVPLWPTQLFASVLGFFGFILAIWLDRKRSFPGYILCFVMAYYTLDRFIVDQFRYYAPSQILWKIGPLTINNNHIILVGLLAFTIFLFFRGRSKQQYTLSYFF